MSAESLLRQLLHETETLLAETELQLHRLDERIRELQAERYGLHLALARHRDMAPDVAVPDAMEPPREVEEGSEVLWRLLSRAEAVERVLEAAARPLSRQEVVEDLLRRGREGDSADAVSAALAYLQRIGRARRADRNQWELVPYATGA